VITESGSVSAVILESVIKSSFFFVISSSSSIIIFRFSSSGAGIFQQRAPLVLPLLLQLQLLRLLLAASPRLEERLGEEWETEGWPMLATRILLLFFFFFDPFIRSGSSQNFSIRGSPKERLVVAGGWPGEGGGGGAEGLCSLLASPLLFSLCGISVPQALQVCRLPCRLLHPKTFLSTSSLQLLHLQFSSLPRLSGQLAT
jgi:hypothetical protein